MAVSLLLFASSSTSSSSALVASGVMPLLLLATTPFMEGHTRSICYEGKQMQTNTNNRN